MKLAIMQPYFFPYVGYFQLISGVDKFIVYDDVNYIMQGWINRNQLLVSGKPYLFSIPIKDRSSFRNIKDTYIAYNENWQQKLVKTIQGAYKKAPYIDRTLGLFMSVVSHRPNTISELAYLSILAVCELLNISTSFVPSSTMYDNTELKGEKRIIDICLKENAKVYINLIGGKELYSKETFSNIGIELLFIEPSLRSYNQHINPFIPNLSILDVLMFNSIEETQELLKSYRLE